MEYREASARKHDTSVKRFFRQQRAKPLIRTKRLRIINWNPGLRLGEQEEMDQAISFRTCAVCFLRHELSWFRLGQVSTTQFRSFPSVLMVRARDGSDVPVSPLAFSSSNIFLLMVLLDKLPLVMQRFENFVQTPSQTVATHDAKVTIIEHNVSSFATRVTMLEKNATSVSTECRLTTVHL